MASAWQSIFPVIFNVEFIIGILGNGFIALVNCIDWVKFRKISSVDKIITALVISRVGQLLVMMVSCYSKIFYPFGLGSRKNVVLISLYEAVANHCGIWFATSLSLFYFLKIAVFSNPAFLYLKQRVDKAVLAMFLGALIYLPFHLIMINIYINIEIESRESNRTWDPKRGDIENFLKLTLLTVGSLTPFSLSLVFSLLLIFSLWKHLKNMKLSAVRSRDPSTETHRRALNIMISFFLLQGIYSLCPLLIALAPHVNENQLFFNFCLAFAIIYPSIHSFILILGNRKLRTALGAVAIEVQLKIRKTFAP